MFGARPSKKKIEEYLKAVQEDKNGFATSNKTTRIRFLYPDINPAVLRAFDDEAALEAQGGGAW